MSGAFDFMVENLAFGERRLGMRATVADSEYLVADAEHGNAIVTQGDTDADRGARCRPRRSRPSCDPAFLLRRDEPSEHLVGYRLSETFDRQPVDHLLEEPSDQHPLRSFPVQPPAHQVIEVIDSSGPTDEAWPQITSLQRISRLGTDCAGILESTRLRLVSKVDVRAASFSIGGGR